MPLLQFSQVTLRYGASPLLDAADLIIEPRERVCLLGRNGSGKTSLLRLIAGEETPNSGEISRQPKLRCTRLNQEIPQDQPGTVRDILRAAVPDDHTEDEWQIDIRIDDLISEMLLPENAEFASLSGGLKRRVLLGAALAGQPDLLLLDEPTNHLDLESILWLEKSLLACSVALLFVTHDRAFLRRLATRIVELDRGRLSSWACDYDTYLERKNQVLEAEEKQWATLDKKLAEEEAWLRQGVKARRTRNEGRVKALLRLREERKARRERPGQARIELGGTSSSGQKVICAENASFGYEDDKLIIRDLTTTLWRGDKIGIVGPNGAGKTTLLKLLLGHLMPVSGTVVPGTNLQVVYLDQLRDQIADDKTVAENVAGSAETVTFQGRARHIHSYLKDFLFPPERARMPAKKLSGGERNRLLLAKLFLQPANLLVLDEPTNDLDMETLELLEDLLVSYAGTLLLVSHDRDFLDEVATATLILDGNGSVVEYPGGCQDWLNYQQNRQALATAEPEPPAELPPEPVVPAPASGEKPRKFYNREKRELEALPAQIESLESELASTAELLADPQLYQRTPEEIKTLTELSESLGTRLHAAYARWDELESLRKASEG